MSGFDDYMIVGDTLILYQGTDSRISVPASLNEGMPLKRIGNKAFAGIRFAEQIVIPEGVASIGRQAFEGCPLLRTVMFPSSISQVDYPRLLFGKCPVLENIEFRCVMTSKELGMLRGSSTIFPYGYRILQNTEDVMARFPYLSDVLLSAGAMPARLPAGLLPPLLVTGEEPASSSSLPYLGRKLEYMYCRSLLREADEVQLFMANMEQKPGDEWLDLSSEEENDLYMRSEKEKPFQKTAIFLVNDSKIRRRGNQYMVPVTARIRYYFWQSSQKVTVSGLNYYIYRRHYLSSMEHTQYMREDVAVFDTLGILTDRKRAEEVYAKYRLSAIF